MDETPVNFAVEFHSFFALTHWLTLSETIQQALYFIGNVFLMIIVFL